MCSIIVTWSIALTPICALFGESREEFRRASALAVKVVRRLAIGLELGDLDLLLPLRTPAGLSSLLEGVGEGTMAEDLGLSRWLLLPPSLSLPPEGGVGVLFPGFSGVSARTPILGGPSIENLTLDPRELGVPTGPFGLGLE